MAMIQCKECGRKISENASLCPHCGVACLSDAGAEIDKKIIGFFIFGGVVIFYGLVFFYPDGIFWIASKIGWLLGKVFSAIFLAIWAVIKGIFSGIFL